MRVTIAGYACLLLLRDPAGYYPRLGTVVRLSGELCRTGPRHRSPRHRHGDGRGAARRILGGRAPWCWPGTVSRRSSGGASGDCNVVVHEFAHQIDAQRGLTEGASLLTLATRYRRLGRPAGMPRRAASRSAQRRRRPSGTRPVCLDESGGAVRRGHRNLLDAPVALQNQSPGTLRRAAGGLRDRSGGLDDCRAPWGKRNDFPAIPGTFRSAASRARAASVTSGVRARSIAARK